jgi:hypothetical protein
VLLCISDAARPSLPTLVKRIYDYGLVCLRALKK